MFAIVGCVVRFLAVISGCGLSDSLVPMSPWTCLLFVVGVRFRDLECDLK